jgi:hypothetical protein
MYSYRYVLCWGESIQPEDVGSVSAENVPLTDAELSVRRSKVIPLWAEPHKVGLNYTEDQQLLQSVVRAGQSTPEILDQLLCNDADASLWLKLKIPDVLPNEDELPSSALALSTPLHAAIAHNNISMLRALLDRGFNPNSRAIITGSLALTPAQYAIIIGRLEAYSILHHHDRLDRNVLTPVFRVHVLHFAAALLRIDLLRATELPLSSAPATALGHTLLHVACLPHDPIEAQTSEKAEQSIHDLRNLFEIIRVWQSPETLQFDSAGKKLHPKPPVDEDGRIIPTIKDRDIPEEIRQQEEIFKLLVSELGVEQIGIGDIHGNMALHYLAGAWYMNKSLITWMRARTAGEHVWQNAENMWGHTPQALWDDNWAERRKTSVANERPGRAELGHGRGGLPYPGMPRLRPEMDD